MRADELSSSGNAILSTPHLDRIVREGASFGNAFVTNALCLPSRATILTGLYSHSCDCPDNRNRQIPASIQTVPDMLREAGYEVAFFGKSHIKDLSRRYWDAYFGIESWATNYYHPVIIESEKGNAKPPATFHGYVDDVCTDRALAWLEGRQEKPFCLFLWFQAPHGPFYRPRHLLDLYNGVPIPKPRTFDDDLKGYPGKPEAFKNCDNKIGTTLHGSDEPRCLEEIVKNHYAGIVANDDCARRVFEWLERRGKMDDTAILLSSDHGFFLGEWHCYNKMFMHEPSIRVPLAVRYPPLIRAGTTSDLTALNLDIAPTMLEIAGLKVPDGMQGKSLLPVMRGEWPPHWRKDWLYEYFDRAAPKNRGIRTEQYKLIHYWEAPEEFELYDLKADPEELHNLAAEPAYATIKEQLRARMKELRAETGDTTEG
jgi:arylsulfatase A-like enzyme